MDNELINKLEDCIHLGYQWIEHIENDYRAGVEDIPTIISKYNTLLGEWDKHVLACLPNAYRRSEYQNAKNDDAIYESGKNVAIQNMIKKVKAKILILKEYKSELRSGGITLGPQARININSQDSSTNVMGDNNTIIAKLEYEFTNNYHGTDKAELLDLINSLKLAQDKKKTIEILGVLLTRGAEMAQVVSLIIQVLQNLG